MMGRTMKTAALAAVLALAGCYSTTIQTGLPPSNIVHFETGHHFIAGLVPDDVDLRNVCAGGQVSSVETYFSFVDLLLNFFTIWIYTPNTVAVVCAAGMEVPQYVVPPAWVPAPPPAPPPLAPPPLYTPPAGGSAVTVEPVPQ